MVLILRKRHLAALCTLLLVLVFFTLLHMKETPATTETAAILRCPETTFVIDAGHGGEDGGAIALSGTPESAINLAVAKRLDTLLGFYGVQTVMTRTQDMSLHSDDTATLRQRKTSDLKNRVALVEATENATLISIHQNSFPVEKYLGAQVFFKDDAASMALAQEVQTLVHDFLDAENQRAVQKIPDSVYLMKNVTCRAILVECGFISNAEDDARLHEDAYQQKIAATIAAACLCTQ